MNKRKEKIAVVHFMPLEYYPPVMNFIDCISESKRGKSASIRVFSSFNVKKRQNYKVPNNNINVYRSSFPKKNDRLLIRILSYLQFNLMTLLNLIFFRPKVILYYESYSA